MMKRLVVVWVLIAALLVGCGGSPKPNDKLSDEAVTALEAAIKTLDSFLAYDISAEEAREKLDRIEASLGTSDTYDKLASGKIYNAAVTLGIYARYESSGSSPDDYNGLKDIKEHREKLYDFLYGK